MCMAFFFHLWNIFNLYYTEMLCCIETRQAQLCLCWLFCCWYFWDMQPGICAVCWRELIQIFKRTVRLAMRTWTAQKMYWKQLETVQSNYSPEQQFPVQTSSGCIYSKRILESGGLCKFWYTLTSATFSAGKISRCQEHSLEMAEFPAFSGVAPAEFRQGLWRKNVPFSEPVLCI